MADSPETQVRCAWSASELMRHYHDEEWGVPLHDDRRLFEAIVLDGAQAGLSWETILRKRESYRAAFDAFDPIVVSGYGPDKVAELLMNPGIIRNRQKVASAIANARAFLAVQGEFGSFDRYLWGFVGGKPIVNAWRTVAELPAQSAESDALSKDLRRRGFSFVGSTICYAFLQAAGLVNDHTVDCYRYRQV